MVSARVIKITHLTLFGLTAVASIVALAVSASLVSHYNKTSYPPYHTGAYRDRIRILLVASIWTAVTTLVLIPGFLLAGTRQAFGLLVHLAPILIAFILFLIGVSSLTALTNKLNCDITEFSRCSVVKGLVIISWIDTIFIFLALIFLLVIAISAKRGYGIRHSTLYLD